MFMIKKRYRLGSKRKNESIDLRTVRIFYTDLVSPS